jgi:oligoribonuclease
MQAKDRLIWIDLEMTGLSPEINQIIEIATVVTDKHLNVIANGPVLAIHAEQKALDLMDNWNQKHHRASGLYQRVQASRVSMTQAEQMTIDFLKVFVEPNTSPICGNSICMDKQFLNRYMPALSNFFHYRQIDVSSFKEIIKRWYPNGSQFEKHSKHLALSDIYDSIEELKFYQTHYLKEI